MHYVSNIIYGDASKSSSSSSSSSSSKGFYSTPSNLSEGDIKNSQLGVSEFFQIVDSILPLTQEITENLDSFYYQKQIIKAFGKNLVKKKVIKFSTYLFMLTFNDFYQLLQVYVSIYSLPSLIRNGSGGKIHPGLRLFRINETFSRKFKKNKVNKKVKFRLRESFYLNVSVSFRPFSISQI